MKDGAYTLIESLWPLIESLWPRFGYQDRVPDWLRVSLWYHIRVNTRDRVGLVTILPVKNREYSWTWDRLDDLGGTLI